MTPNAPILERMASTVWSSFAALVTGIVVALVGGVAHRSVPWWGVIGCIALVVCVGTFARAWRGWLALGIFAGAWVGVTYMLSMEGPGGSYLIVDDALGRAWLIGGSVAVIAVSFIPRSWLMDSDDVPF